MATDKSRKKNHFDAEYSEWHRRSPEFPGIDLRLRVFGSPDYSGAWQDVSWLELTNNAPANVSEYIAVAKIEIAANGKWAKTILYTLAHLRMPECVELFSVFLDHELDEHQEYGEFGLESFGKTSYRFARIFLERQRSVSER